jgi:hypothetical protein
VIALVFAAALATAPSADRAEAERLYDVAVEEERDASFAHALADYEASVRIDPSNRYALRSTARARWLRDRSEGGFAPLVALEKLRRDPNSQSDAAAIDALARKLETFPPGEVRIEARMFVAESYATKLHRPRDAERELDALLDEPKGDVPLRAQAAKRLVDLAEARGDVGAARHAADRVLRTNPTLALEVTHWARRRVMLRVAITALSAFVALGVFSAARNLRGARIVVFAKFAAKAALLCVYLAIIAVLLANAYERGHTLPFLALPATLFPILLVARAWGLSGERSKPARAARAFVSALAVASAAFLVLHAIDVRYLMSFGL